MIENMNARKLIFDWRVKVMGEKLVSLLPFGYDYKIYSKVAHRFLDIDTCDFDERIEKGLSNLELIKDKTNFSFDNKSVMEIGTGLHGVDPLLFYLLGFKEIITLDHIQHLKKGLMESAVRTLGRKLADIAIRFDIDVEVLKERYSSIASKGSLDELLRSCHIHTFGSVVPDVAAIEEGSIDLFYSESCLQRIPVYNLQNLFKALPIVLSRDAISFVRLDTKDINAIWFKNLWGLNYLRYSELSWRLLTAEKFNNQNRLREKDFLLLLNSAGLHNFYIESYLYDEDIAKLENFPVAKCFQDIPLADLAIVASKIICTRKKHADFERRLVKNGGI